jgi:hypothetical protein
MFTLTGATTLLSACALEPYPPLPIPPEPQAVTYGGYSALPMPPEPQGPAPAFAPDPERQGEVDVGAQPAPVSEPQAASITGAPLGTAGGSQAGLQTSDRTPVQPEAWRGDPAAFIGPPRPGPRKLTVRLKKQRFEYSEGDAVVHTGEITSGSPGHPTPKGSYSVLSKDPNKRSGSYTNYFNLPTPMPYALQFRGPYYVHEGWIAGSPESHGCVRLRYEDARFVFERMRVGDRIAVLD